MAPKKKGNKKADDDWGNEALEETHDPISAATQEAKAADVTQAAERDDAIGSGGGLLAALKKNKQNKKKKGKHVEEDFLDGEDPLAENGVNGHTEPDGLDTTTKAPEEATADDLFAAPATKGKGGKTKPGKKDSTLQVDENGSDGSGGEGGGLKSKKEKEKDKKEREKQRKKEQVSSDYATSL